MFTYDQYLKYTASLATTRRIQHWQKWPLVNVMVWPKSLYAPTWRYNLPIKK